MKWKRKIVLIPIIAGACLFGLWLVFGGTGLPKAVDRPVSYTIRNGHDTTLGRLSDALLVERGDKSGVYLLANGLDAFVARACLARMAERSIDVQYYMFHQDTVGRLLIKELLDAAGRGVRVRMLIDDMYGSEADDVWTALDAHPQIEVRLFNPFTRERFKYLRSLFQAKRVIHRMHSKSFTVDNQAAIVGGRNIGDEYFDANPDLAFADMDLLTVGPVVPQVSAAFDQYWNSTHVYPASALAKPADPAAMAALRETLKQRGSQKDAEAYINALEHSDLAVALQRDAVPFQWAEARLFHDTSEKGDRGEGWEEQLLISQLWPYLNSVTDELILVTPYFVPLENGTEALCKMSRRGVTVRILTNSLASNDVSAVHAGYAPHREKLLKAGVILYELDEDIRTQIGKRFTWLPGLKKSSLHAKTMVLDQQTMFVGSMNLDQMSLRINNEIGILFKNPPIAGQSAQAFDKQIEKVAFRLQLHKDDEGNETIRWHQNKDGREIVFEKEPYVGFWKKLGVKVIGLLPVESLL
jgi:putative cardiolipin synthase